MTQTAYFQPGPICVVDDIPMGEHARCRGCHILAGQGHYDSRLAYGYCEMCRARPSMNEMRQQTEEQIALEARDDEAWMLRHEQNWPIERIAAEIRLTRRAAFRAIERARARRRKGAA